MSVPPSQLQSVRQSVPLQQVLQPPVPGPVPQEAANDVRMHPAEEALPEQPQGRTAFVSVKNLHQGDGLRNLFNRVEVSNDQIKDRLGDDLFELYDIHHSANGMPRASLKQDKKHDYELLRGGYEEIHKELKAAKPPAGDKPSVFQRLKLMIMGDARSKLDISVEGKNEAAESVNLKLGIDNQVVSQQATLHHPDNYETDRSVGTKKALYTVGTIAALALGGAVIATATLSTLPFVAAAAGGLLVAVGLGMTAKAAVGKHPWWGGTAVGQLQRAEREHARSVGDGIAHQVKATMMVDGRKRNVEGNFEARDIIQDKEALQNFIRLAKEKNSARLYKDIRKALLQKDSSPLSDNTIDRVTNRASWLQVHKYLFQGAQGQHAQKTVDTYAREITMGIMRGVNEAFVESLLGGLSDEVSNAGQAQLKKILGEDNAIQTQFTEALRFLSPVGAEFPIAKTDENIKTLQAMLNSSVVVGAKAGSIDGAIAQVKQSEEALGKNNVDNFVSALTDLKQDVEKHIASQQDVKALIEGGGAQGVTLNAINELLASLLTDEHADEGQAKAAADTIQTRLKDLKDRINNPQDKNASALVREHATQLLALVDAVTNAATAAADAATTITSAVSGFKEDALTMDRFTQLHDPLKQLLGKQFPDMNPSGQAANVKQAHESNLERLNALLKTCKGLDDAGSDAKELNQLQTQANELAAQGQLDAALEKYQRVEDLHKRITEFIEVWTGEGFKKPVDLPVISPAQWKRDVVAAYLGINNQAEALTSILDRLIASSGKADGSALQVLRKYGEQNPESLIPLLSNLQTSMAGAPAEDSGAQQALDLLHELNATLMMGADAAGTVTAALHPKQQQLLSTYRNLDALHDSLRSAEEAFGDALRLINDEPLEAAGAGKPVAFLNALSRFCEDHPQALSDASQKEALKTVTEKLNGMQDNFNTWGAKADQVLRFGLDELNTLQILLNAQASEGHETRTEILRQNQLRLEQEAAAKAVAAQLAQGAQHSSAPALKEAVSQAAQPLPGIQLKDLEATVQDLLACYAERARAQSNQRLSEADLMKIATELSEKLKFKGEPQALVERIQQHPGIQRLLRRHLEAHTLLKDFQPEALPAVATSFTDAHRLEGARNLADFKKTSAFALEKLTQAEKHHVRRLVEARDRLTSRFQNSKGEPLGESGIGAKLKNSATRAQVDQFMHEERVYQFLREVTKTQENTRTLRVAMEESGADVEVATKSLVLLKQQSVSHASHLVGYIEKGIQIRVTAIETLIDSGNYDAVLTADNDSQWDPKVAYLGSELFRLQEQLNGLKVVEATLKDPATHDLAALGRMLREADAVINASPENVRLSYIRAQQKETADALKYFNVRNFSVKSPGWGVLGDLYFRLFDRRDEALRQVAQRNDAKAIADSISLIASQATTSDELRNQAKRLDGEIAKLEHKKMSMVTDPSKVKAALALVTLEQLAESGGETVTDAMRTRIFEQWHALLGEGVKHHDDIIQQVGKFTRLQELANLLKLDEGLVQTIAEQREAIRTEQRELDKKAQELRQQITKAALEKAQRVESQTIANALTLGLDETDYLSLKPIFGDVGVRTYLDKWMLATSLLEEGKQADAWAVASDTVMSMERALTGGQLPGAQDDRAQRAAKALLGKLERNFLDDFPVPNVALDSIRDPARPAAQGDAFSQRAFALFNQAGKIGELKSATEINELRDKVLSLEAEVNTVLSQHKLDRGGIPDGQPFSRRALQRLGVETQMYLGYALHRIGRHTQAPEGEPTLSAKAKYHLYNAAMIKDQIDNSQRAWAPQSYPSADASTYATSAKSLPTLFKNVLEEAIGPLDADRLESLADQARGAIDSAFAQPGMDDRDDMENYGTLSSAMIQPSAQEKAPGQKKRGLFSLFQRGPK